MLVVLFSQFMHKQSDIISIPAALMTEKQTA